MIRKLFPHVLKGIFNSICHISHMNTSTHLLESFFVSFCGSTGATVSCFSSGFDLSCCCAALEDDWGASSSFTGFSGFSEVVKKNNYSVNIFKSNNYCSSFWVTFVCRKTACTSINVETWFKIQTQLLTTKHWKHQITAAKKKVVTWHPCFPSKTYR